MRSLILFTLLISLQSFAQPFCGNFGSPNRKNRVTITSLETESQQWNISSDPGVSVKDYFRDENLNDSVVIYRNGVFSGYFRARYDKIISPCLVLRDEKGTIQSIDSFRVDDSQFGEMYYGSFGGNLTMRREYYPSGIPSKVLYKNRYGADSLTIEWSPGGVIRRKRLYWTEYLYSPDGMLTGRFSGNDSLLYTNGIITYLAKDTTILNQWVRLVKEYSPKGTLLKEKWFKDDKPVSTWREYNAEGVLVKTIKHPALVKLPVQDEIMAVAAEEVFAFVSESSEFPGGRANFEKYMNPELQSIFSSSDFQLWGTYKIRFEVAEDGKPVFTSVQGENAASIESSLKGTIERMPKWKPAKRSGTSVREGLVLKIRVSE